MNKRIFNRLMSETPDLISKSQLQLLETERRTDFVLEVVSDWYALFEALYRKSALLPFEQAMETADDLVQKVARCPQYFNEDASYTLIHHVLLAQEQGVPLERVNSAVGLFFACLPAHEAGFALLSSLFRPRVDAVASVPGAKR